jgi:phage terminase large subunit-like protein
VLRSTERRIALVIGRQAGKSTVAAILATHQATYHPGSLVLMTAPSQRQAAELYLRSRTLYRQLGRVVASEAENQLS